ncbi:hypothetical protein TNCV_3514791, partial [Trichonephila clavipes]
EHDGGCLQFGQDEINNNTQKHCAANHQRKQVVFTDHGMCCVPEHIEVGGVCDTVKLESYEEKALHVIDDSTDGDKPWC